MKKAKNVILALIPALLVFVLMVLDPLYNFDAMMTDNIYSQMNGCGDTIKLICIDEETLSEYGPLSTWSRVKSAELVEKLYENPQYAPAVLAFDIMFVGETDPETDNRLAEAAKGAGNIVAATNLVYRGKINYTAVGVPYYDSRNIETEELPFEALNRVVSSGYANAQLSRDGFARTMQIGSVVEDVQRYSFATQIYNEYVKVKGEDSVEPLPKDNQVMFFYSGEPGEFIHYSLKDVLDGKVPSQEFADAIVMVGAYASGLQDSYHNSAKRGQDMYGVEINANIVRALMLGKTAVPLSVYAVAGIVALMIFIYTYLSRKMKMYPAIIVGVWLVIIYGIVGRILATNGYFISLVYVPLVCILIWAFILGEKYILEGIKRRQTLNSFKKYMAPQVIESLRHDGDFHIELGGEKKNIAVLFVDIRGFTSMSESVSPEQMVRILNKYLSLTTSCIFNHGGMLDKFIGDATMAIFNAPNDQEDYVYEAVMAGLEMQKRGAELGEQILEEFGKTVSFGVGINVGDAVVGNIGCENRMDYTAIGDTVNTASRIEGQAKGGDVLISEAVYKQLKGRINTEFYANMTLKGKAEPVPVYKVFE